ncbi:endoplasmic reticulum metallopeptidase 1 isoform X2 [Hyla sarda]|uniref:endoplasmic reticulum metallopeptidase 1 isoform X2 n=1 Tax=Hyla sarda TaxID=327740 RepID=UPI0024C2883E|nr:endoplasmic reticulum metallopeptidase 1 isoform X2 [Hyla sarda]
MERSGGTGLAVRRSRNNVVSSGAGSGHGNRREDKGGNDRKTRGRSLVFGAGVSAVLLLYVLGLRVLVHFSLRQLVTPGTRSTGFNASTARVYLEHITAIDSRTVGSPANEIVTVNYLLDKIKEIEMKSSKVHKITVDIQRPTGTFSIDFLGGFTSYYDNITNVAVKLEPSRGAQHAVLANCHFDSVANTPGASDDAVSCAVMLEILSSLSSTSVPLKHAIIFLFNGAEENILQGSHGFITQHQWAKLVRAFINLEAAGVGGKELVFQTGPENPWLVQAYSAAAVHPFASVVAQEVFQSGIIPSDTDFRIYRDFGNIPGIDLAFIENGYIYHTKYDTADRIHTDTIQRAGDNILEVLRYLASSPLLADSSEYRHGNLIFFDVSGMFLVSYPARIGTIINYTIAAVTLFYLSKKTIKYRKGGINYARDLMIGLFISVTSWISALVTVLIIAVLVSLTGNSLSWYTHFYVAVSLYGAAAVAKIILLHTTAKTFYFANSSRQYLGDLFFDVSLLSWGLPMMLLTQKGLCSAYFFAMWVIFPLVTKFFAEKESLHRGSSSRYLLVYLLGLFYPYLHTTYHVWAVFEMFTPIFGRSGTEIPPDVVLASFLVICTVILLTCFVKFIYLVKSTKTIILLLAAVSGVTFILVCSGMFFPYSGSMESPKPKRIFLQHTSRRFHNLNGDVVKQDSGIWMNGFDYNGITHLTPHIPELNDTVRAPCDVGPFCGFPWYFPVHLLLKKNWYLPAPHPPISEDMEFKLESREEMPWGSIRMNFEVKGPSHITVYIRPHENCLLSSWSLGDGIPVSGNGGDYFIYYSHGLQAPAWKFWIEVKGLDGHLNGVSDIDGIITVAAASHYFFGENQHSPELDSLLQRFPNWCFPSSWVSLYKQYVY